MKLSLRLFISLIPTVLRAFGLTKATWEQAIAATGTVQREYMRACADAEAAGRECTYSRLKAWAEIMGKPILAQMSSSEFWLNLVRELALLTSKHKNGALLLAGMLLFLPSCTVIHGDQTKGTYTMATLGGDLNEMSQTAQGYTVAKLDTSSSFRETSSALKNYVWAGAFKSVATTAGSAFKSVTKTKEATKTVGIQEKGLTERAGIAADVEKTKILNPEPEGF
jgi:hypothetical protein